MTKGTEKMEFVSEKLKYIAGKGKILVSYLLVEMQTTI